MVKSIGLISKSYFTRNGGLELAIMRSFVPQVGILARISCLGEGHSDLALNLAKSVGILAVNASSIIVKSYNFYK